MTAFYNEIDPYAAQWSRNLIAAGHIADGIVSEESIEELYPNDLREFTQCHFFAGIGVWSYALRLAGWPDERRVWTGSCPCQPFSVAGKNRGTSDERHLWPAWFHLIDECRPTTIFGEQVESAVKHGWLDLVQSDLEGIDYAVGHVAVSAGSVGAPHIRQRLWFVADNNNNASGRYARAVHAPQTQTREMRSTNGLEPSRAILSNELAHSESERRGETRRDSGRSKEWQSRNGEDGTSRMEYAESAECQRHRAESSREQSRLANASAPIQLANDNGLRLAGERGSRQDRITEHCQVGSFWQSADWLYCKDGKYRPVESGTFPLAHGATARVGRLRAYGNAIVPQVASEVIQAFMSCRP